MKKKNWFIYQANENTRKEGFFNIFQSKNGGIALTMGFKTIQLTKNQVDNLNLDCYELQDFDHDQFLNFYKQ